MTRAAYGADVAVLVSATAMTASADTTGPHIQTRYAPETVSGKLAAFQFVGDITSDHDAPYQQLNWLYYGGGLDAEQALYNKYDMQPVGWWVYGQESFTSSKPIANVEGFTDGIFRSPPGMETKIFERFGAKLIVMDFTEIFTALETAIIDGADASGLANNVGLGVYDLVKYANYPGFHSMPSYHLACNKGKLGCDA